MGYLHLHLRPLLPLHFRPLRWALQWHPDQSVVPHSSQSRYPPLALPQHPLWRS